ncbi:muconolactone Delta-isomerase family protein [Pseudonocardia lutea]|jgi:muconolactone D-isomerase|uniref:Muconolactone Delta-isomerase family protein n=1 Tax=Pseudonocardia lutea TaxID=2172015 RepID=A0ABW1IBE5_9PSEU
MQFHVRTVFDVDSGDDLHALPSSLPLFPHTSITVTPPATHPSDLKAQS